MEDIVDGARTPGEARPAPTARPTVVAFGHFVSHEHTTTGLVRALQTADGARALQNYQLPTGIDLARLNSVSIWCERFRVSFGAAELR